MTSASDPAIVFELANCGELDAESRGWFQDASFHNLTGIDSFSHLGERRTDFFMSLFFELGTDQSDLSAFELKNGLFQALRALGPRNRVLVIPPDMTRFHSGAGNLTSNAYEFYGKRLSAVLPAVRLR